MMRTEKDDDDDKGADNEIARLSGDSRAGANEREDASSPEFMHALADSPQTHSSRRRSIVVKIEEER